MYRPLALLSPFVLAGAIGASAAVGWSSSYHFDRAIPISGEARWDHPTVDAERHRLFVPHGDSIEVVDLQSKSLIAQIHDTPNVRDIVLAPELRRGFTSNGGDKSVTIFDLETLRVVAKVAVNDPDAIFYDPFTKRIFPLSGVTTVIDAQRGEKVGELHLAGEPESGVSDGHGTLYVNLAGNDAIGVVNARSLALSRTIPIVRCHRPHTLLLDATSKRLLVGCSNAFFAVALPNGETVAAAPLCGGVDAAAFDSKRRVALESCREGVVSVIRQVSPNFYQLVDTVKTQIEAKTMAFNARDEEMYLPVADTETVADPAAPGGYHVDARPGTLRVLVLRR